MANGRRRKLKFNRKMQIKLLAVFAFVLLMLGILLTRITYIMARSGNKYAKQVLSQQNYDSQTIPYRRGEILDRNGIILARSDRVYNVIMDCKVINSDENYKEPTVKALLDNFNLSETDIRDRIDNEKTRNSQYQILLKKISEDQKRAFEDYTDTSKEMSAEERRALRNVKGIWFEEQYDRQYPYDSLASNAGMEDAVRQKYGFVVDGEETAVVSGLSETAGNRGDNVEANVLSSSVKAPEEWYTPYLDALFGVQ